MSLNRLSGYLVFLVAYVILILAHGYLFATGDLVQLHPLVLASENPALYPNDLYIQHASDGFPNERYFFLWFLKILPGQMEWMSFIFHFLFTMLLLAGIKSLASRFIRSTGLQWLVAGLLFLPFYSINLGSNELYYGIFHPSLAAKAVAIWALVYWQDARLLLSILLTAIATLLHPVAGLQVFVLVFLAEVVYGWFSNRKPFSKPLVWGTLLWAASAGAFILAMFFRFRDADATGIDFFQVFYVFRNPHHYIPSAFPETGWWVIGTLTLIGLLTYYGKSGRFMYFLLLNLLVLCGYTLFVEVFHSETIATLQWFKSTIWMELLGTIALVRLLERFIQSYSHGIKQSITMVAWVAVLGWGWFFTPGYDNIRTYQSYQLPFTDYTNDAIDISEQVRGKTAIDALFLHPCHFTELKYFGRRSSFVEYKALTHTKSFLLEWSERLKLVYKLDYNHSPAGYATCSFADGNFRQLTIEEISSLHREYGVTHLLTWKDVELTLPIVAANDTYVVYDCQNLGH